MCGRYSAWLEIEALARALHATVVDGDFAPLANVAPTMLAPVVVGRPERRIGPARFGFSLGERREGGKAPPFVVNARSETAATSPAFREAAARRRCLVPADGYYEWRVENGTKQPYRFGARDGSPLLMLGLYQVKKTVEAAHREPAFVVLTQPARGVAATVHDRMPIIVPRTAVDPWLDPQRTDAERLLRDALAASVDAFRAYPVDRAVSSPAAQGEALRRPVGPDLGP